MKKSKKIIVLVMACVMLFGATLTVQAANCPPHRWANVTSYGQNCPLNHPMFVYKCDNCGGWEVRCSHGHS